ncbi:MAG: rhodanese-like domain-containing protein [Blastocatellia bacterium]
MLEKSSRRHQLGAHCKMGRRGAKAYDAMKKAGFTKIKNLKGGILAWADQVDRTMTKY